MRANTFRVREASPFRGATREERYAAFDTLPRELRDALNALPFPVCPLAARLRLSEVGLEECLRRVRTKGEWLAAQSGQTGWVRP